MESEPQDYGGEMRRRRKFVFRDDEEERSRVRSNLSKAMAVYPAGNLYDDEVDWYGAWDSLFPSQQEVLSAVEKAITQAENESGSN